MTDATDDQDALSLLFTDTRAVLFDFDGPVCDLFRGASTGDVAERVKDAARPYWGRLDHDVESCDDSHGILRRLRDMYERSAERKLPSRPLELAEKIVTAQEAEALRTAVRAPHIVTLIDLLLELPVLVAVVSNNAEGPIRAYLEEPDLQGKFVDVFGRDPDDARRMKPDPHCVDRALEKLVLPASSCIVIGDQLTDLKASRAVGTCFIGYTQDETRAREMTQSGANAVVSTHLSVIKAVERFRATR
jgi:HAD superfamily hydrolase (TIGR01509 family)